MKRVTAACICQTLHFMLKEEVGHDYTVKQVKEEEKSNGSFKSIFRDGTYWQAHEAIRHPLHHLTAGRCAV